MDVAIANLREISLCDIFCPVVNAKGAHLPLHIDVSSADPNFANEDVFKGEDFGRGRDEKLIRSTCFWCFDGGLPLPFVVGFGSSSSEVPRSTDSDGFVRFRGSPDGRFALLLQDHTVLEDRVELEFLSLAKIHSYKGEERDEKYNFHS